MAPSSQQNSKALRSALSSPPPYLKDTICNHKEKKTEVRKLPAIPNKAQNYAKKRQSSLYDRHKIAERDKKFSSQIKQGEA
jgi:hypothetical protein